MIVDVDLDPTMGSKTGKLRPAIVVTNDTYNERVPVIQVVATDCVPSAEHWTPKRLPC